MGGSASKTSKTSKTAARTPVADGVTRICVSGWPMSHHTSRAAKIARKIVSTYPEKYESWFYFDLKGFRPGFLASIKSELSDEQQKDFESHKTSPFCWIETYNSKPFAIGGRDKLCEWAIETFKDEKKDDGILSLCKSEPSLLSEAFVDKTPGTAQTELGTDEKDPETIKTEQVTSKTEAETDEKEPATAESEPGSSKTE
mmetsp:Transcript_25675/g.37817  ORF Transcript_25675/g.37817 Transcript_25675/m.37817 type:complete len:200 (-) Transcript_25675:145-744(-)